MNIQPTLLNFKRAIKLPIILQDEIAECGHACIAMISQYFGHRFNLHELRKIDQPPAHGVTLRHIIRLFGQLKFNTRALCVPLSELHLIQTPAILHWNMNHFVVLKQIKKNKVILHDPAVGVRTCSIEEFNHSYTGVVLEVEKSHDFAEIRYEKKLRLFDIVKIMPNIYRLLTLLLALSLSIEFLALLNPFFIQYATDQAISSSNLGNLYTVSCGFVLFVLLQALAEYVRGHLILYTTTHFKNFFSSNVFKHLLALPTSFFESRHQGDIQSKFQSIEQIQTKISTDFINTLLDGLMLLINLTIMFLYSKLLTLIVLIALAFYVGIRYVSYQSLKKRTASSVYLHAKMASFFLETLRAITPIKLFLKESARFQIWRNGYIDALNVDINLSKQQILYRVANQFVFNLEHIIVICIGVQLILTHTISIGMLIAFLAFRAMLVNKSSSLIQNLFDYQLISVQLNRLSDILFQEAEPTNKKLIEATHIVGSLTLEDISFQYDSSDNFILKPLNIHVEPGEKIAIIGPSGCGKTTLLKIMLGILSPSTGKLLIDGIPINTLGLNNYRNITAAVMQYDSLLTGSLVDNITFFEEQINLELVYEAAQLANIHETICSMPMGYETLIGDMGSTLSGGQKQRLLLARALYKKPKILFLDEATNHLDDNNERQINQALKALNITQIIVAHRQETIKMADRVIDLT
ncbi:MAG: peptidase domain-containing ABC transporter [Legionellaceae bacterium]|nr:peptidase domain-containing ABC transporter [Legionellaceae bacterium]